MSQECDFRPLDPEKEANIEGELELRRKRALGSALGGGEHSSLMLSYCLGFRIWGFSV